MIPVSSRIEKYGLCDTISLGYLKGNRTGFLLQNICTVTERYILNEYRDAQTNDIVAISNNLKKDLNAKAHKIIRLAKKGTLLCFTDIVTIRDELMKDLEEK